MALLSRKEFAALCHTTPAIVTTNIGRNKIVEFEKKIDSENAINKAFFDKYIAKSKVKQEKLPSSKEIDKLYKKTIDTLETAAKNEVNEKQSKSRRKKVNDDSELEHNWDLRKKKADALLKERTAEKALLSVKKMYGEMLPTDFVVLMFTTFTKSVLSIFDNAMMNLAGVYCDELAGGDRAALAKVNQKLNEEFQTIINEAAEIAKKDLTNQIKEYSVKRSKGEKK